MPAPPSAPHPPGPPAGRRSRAASMRRPLRRLAGVGLLMLAACGGGGGVSTQADPQPPVAPPVQPPVQPPAAAPTFSAQPADAAVAAGQSARFEAAADGSAPLGFQWLRDGQPIAGATQARYDTPATAAGDDGARFSVRVSNAAGSVVSREARLTVLPPVAARAQWLAGVAALSGPYRDATVQYYDLPGSRRLGDLLLVDTRARSAPRTVAGAGEWLPHASVWAADVAGTPAVATRLRERFRTFLRNGRLHRIDLEPAAGDVPVAEQVSSLGTGEVCEGDQQVYQQWTAPQHAWFVFPAPAEGVANCYSQRSWRAVRLDMAAGEAPLTLTARPVAALRDARGAIEGFVLQRGQQVLLADAGFRNARLLLENTDGGLELRAHGVHGRGDRRYLLYHLGNSFQPAQQQLRALPLDRAGSSVLLASDVRPGPVVAEDAAGLVFAAGRRLLQVDAELAVRTLTDMLPPNDGRLFLTPTRVVLVAGNISPTAVVSVPRQGGAPATLLTLSGNGDPYPTLVTVGEDVYVQIGVGVQQGGLHIVGSDGSQPVRLDSGYIAATLRPAAMTLDAQATGFDHAEQREVVGAATAGGLLVVESAFNDSASQAPVVRYGSARMRTELGRLPGLLQSNWPLGEAEPGDVRLGHAAAGFQRRYLTAVQRGGFGLLQRQGGDLFLVDDAGAGAVTRVTAVEPAP